MDDAVSYYFKLKSDHHGRYSNPVRSRYRVGNVGAQFVAATGKNRRGEKPMRRSLAERLDSYCYRYITRVDADFPRFFLRYYFLPYDTWARLSHADFDYVIHFETLKKDFARVLEMLGIKQVRPLPILNKTEGRSPDFWKYYTPEIIPRARWVFGPYMERFGYQFPSEWGDRSVTLSSHMAYAAISVPRIAYWRFIHSRK